MTLWNCKVCKKKMAEKYKGSHLAGRPHAQKVAAAGDSAPEAEDEVPPEPEKPKWKCPTCNCIMKTKYRRSHLGSKPHNTKLIAAGGTPEFWNCNICNSTMPVYNKAQHLAGKRHTASLKKQPPPKVKKAKKAKAESGDADPQAHTQTLTSDPGPPHPNGKLLIKICEVRDVYDDVNDMPTEAWEQAHVSVSQYGRDSLVTATEVQEARDIYESWDGDDSQPGSPDFNPRVPVDTHAGWD